MEAYSHRHLRFSLLILFSVLGLPLTAAEPPKETFTALPASPAVYSWEEGDREWRFSLAGTLGFVRRDSLTFHSVLNQPWGVQKFFRSSGSPRIGLVSQGRIQIWDYREGLLVLDLDPAGFTGVPALSPEGSLLAFVQNEDPSGGYMPYVTVLDVASGKVFRRFPGVDGPLEFNSPFQLKGRLFQGKKALMNLVDGSQRSEARLPPAVSAEETLSQTGQDTVTLDMPVSPRVESLAFIGEALEFTFTLGENFFRFKPGYYSEAEVMPGPPAFRISGEYPLPPGAVPPPGALKAWSRDGTLFVHTGFNNRIHVFFTPPDSQDPLTAVYDQPFLEGAPTALDLSSDGQWMAVGDDLGRILVWNIPSGRAAGYWDVSPLAKQEPLTGLGPGPWEPLMHWDPLTQPFPLGIQPPAWDDWRAEAPQSAALHRRRIPWTDRLPEALKGNFQYGNPQGTPIGFTLVRGKNTIRNGGYPMTELGEYTFILQSGETESRLIRINAQGLPDTAGVLPGRFTRLTAGPGNNLMVTGTEPVRGFPGKVRLLFWVLDSGLNIQEAHRSFFLAAGDPQVQSGRESPWVGFHWSEKLRDSWTSTLKFFNFQDKKTWELQLPYGLDMSSHYSTAHPELLTRDGKGSFLLLLSGVLRTRPRDQGTGLISFTPENRRGSSRYLPLPAGTGILALRPASGGTLVGMTQSGPLIWPQDSQPEILSLPNLSADRVQWSRWSQSPENPETAVTLPLPMEPVPSPGWALFHPDGRLLYRISMEDQVLSLLSQDFRKQILVHFRSREYQFRSEDEEAFLWYSFTGETDGFADTAPMAVKTLEAVPGLPGTPAGLPLPYLQDTTSPVWNWESYSAEIRREGVNFIPIFSR